VPVVPVEVPAAVPPGGVAVVPFDGAVVLGAAWGAAVDDDDVCATAATLAPANASAITPETSVRLNTESI
jgi:hypothetical protein